MGKINTDKCSITFDESNDYTLKDIIIDKFVNYMNDKYKNIDFQRK